MKLIYTENPFQKLENLSEFEKKMLEEKDSH